VILVLPVNFHNFYSLSAGNGAAGKKLKNKTAHKTSTGTLTKPSSSEDFFGFLNKVNESQLGGNTGKLTAGNGGGGAGKRFVPNSVIASQQRAAAHKNTKASKFF
jgi:hypothetical protein